MLSASMPVKTSSIAVHLAAHLHTNHQRTPGCTPAHQSSVHTWLHSRIAVHLAAHLHINH